MMPARYPSLAKAFVTAVALEYQRLFDQLIRLGTLSATERLADLLYELHRRLEPVSLASQGRFALPVDANRARRRARHQRNPYEQNI